MSLAPARTRRVYATIPSERQATAACYCCSTQMPVEYVLWMHHAG